MTRWSVELAGAAVAALRALPAEERARVAARIDHLVEFGLPPALRGDETGVVAVPAGGHELLCIEEPVGRRIVIVTLRAESARRALGRLLRHALPRWLTGWMGGGMESFAQDLRFAVRSLRRSPAFSTAAVLTLALGIGATAAVFSVAKGVLLDPLPYADADEVVTVWSSWSNFPDKTWVSVPEYRYYANNNSAFEDLALYSRFTATFTSVDNPERVGAVSMTPNTLSVLGVEPALGRSFTEPEAQDSVPPVMIGYDAWQRRYAGDPSIVGRTVELFGSRFPVVGVLPAGFVLPIDYASSEVTEVAFPSYVDLDDATPFPRGGGSHGSYVVGRLHEGETARTALADLENILDRLRAEGLYPPEFDFHPRVFPVKDDIVGSARATILVLLGACGLVLLIACGNVANLLLSRAEARVGEIGVRSAMGASRRRVLRQLFTESFVLAGAAGALGLVFAWLGVDALLSIDPDAVPRSGGVVLDGGVVAFTILVTVSTAALFGLAPALRVTRVGVSRSLREGGDRGGRGAGSSRTQGLLVATQMAMAVVLLTGSGLMMKSFVGLLGIDPGFRAENVLTMRISVSQNRAPTADDVARFYEEVLDGVRALPGVRRAGAVRLLPLATTMGDAGFRPLGYTPQPNESTQADWQWATPGYVETMGIPLLEGRTFDERDRRDGQKVVMVNETVAKRYWGDESPLGRAVVATGDTAIVVGVVGDLRHNGITTDVKTRFYKPHAQVPANWSGTMRGMTLTIAAAGDPRALVTPVRDLIRRMDPSMAVSDVRTMDEVMAGTVAQQRFALVLLGAFAALALTLAVVGVYGVLAYTVSKRHREIGIRMALGAEVGQVIGLVVRQGMVMAVSGVLLGTGVAWLMADLMSALLYQTAPRDATTFLAVPALFVAVALLASWLPAARAARVEPASALRYE